MKGRITPEEITLLPFGQIFTFGANEAGRHGKGAAWTARYFGAHWNMGFGPIGRTFAIPTKDWKIEPLPLDVIGFYVSRFIAYARVSPALLFLVTPIGCGLAGYTAEDIAPLFAGAVELENVHLPQSFWDVLTQTTT